MTHTYRVRVGSREFEVAVEEAEGGLVVSLCGATHRVDVADVVPGWYSLLVDGRPHDVGLGPDPRTLVLDGETYAVEAGGTVASGGAGRGRSASRTGEVRAPMPGLVVGLQAAAGAGVATGQLLIIMEAMKMQMEIRAPHTGTVRQVHVAAGQEVAGGQLLVTIE